MRLPEGAAEPFPGGRERHDPSCKWPGGWPCLRFSTDGTFLGAEIAHTLGTTEETGIIQKYYQESAFVSDIAAEQADWDNDLL